ncbi:MAG: SLATT domain-containing protein [Anaerolineales bacterium]
MMNDNTDQITTPILKLAWERYSQYDAFAVKRNGSQLRLRRWVAIIGVAATLFAIIVQIYGFRSNDILSWVFKVLLILAPISGSILAAFGTKFYGGGDWLTLRAGAEEILKEIYHFRTILQDRPDRRAYLENRLQEIQRQVYRGMNGEIVMQPYEGKLPPYYYSNDPYSDPGFKDLDGQEYFKYRLQNQLGYHTYRVNKYQRERIRLQWFILAAGGAGAFLAALGGGFSLWVALTASTTTALIGWQELRNLDATVRNYSKVILELTIISDHWNNLGLEERTDSEFYQMVQSTESILWSQNVEYIKSMQEALTAAKSGEENLVDQVLRQSVEQDQEAKQTSAESDDEERQTTLTQSDQSSTQA